MTACLYFHPEAYTTTGPRLMGRNAAGESFLRGFLAHSKTPEFWVQVDHRDHAESFAGSARASGRAEPIRVLDKGSLVELSKPGVIYYPGPGIGEHAWHRAAHGHAAWSLCGITHTTSSARAMDALVNLIDSPVQPWDAVICTSHAVKSNVECLLQAQVGYLKERLGITKLTLPQLPVIPLGIHTQDFEFSPDQRISARNSLGINDDTLVVLFVGRLSFHAKAHPLAFYRALELAAAQSGKDVLLIECGWHANESIAKAYEQAAELACPSIRVVTVDGRKAEERGVAWASADIFCSLSDNIQETFGIVPIEAMAAGLPVVVSDWDGYKDTVRDGVDGFRIPTLMPQAGLGGDLATRHALEIDTYDMYCGHTCSLIAVDVDAASQAFARLFESPELRRKMGEAGKLRAKEVYDWRVIIPQYENLWSSLAEMRNGAEGFKVKPLAHPWPARMDPFYAFASYPTKTLTVEAVISLIDSDPEAALARVAKYRQLAMVNFAAFVLPSAQEVSGIISLLGQNALSVGAVIKTFPTDRQAYVFRSLVWLNKLGILRVAS